jgi:hypothetical protein
MGFFSVLGLIFITLKLLGVIDWAWLWVLAPLLAEIALVAILIMGYAVIFFMAHTRWR